MPLVDERFELFSAPLDGSSAPVLLSGSVANAGMDVTSLIGYIPGNEVVFRADRTTDDQFELYSSSVITAQAAPRPPTRPG